MSDTPKLPASPNAKSEPEIKDAVPAGKGVPPPNTKQLTLTHQFFIWTMIVIVGVLFGVGSSCSMMAQPVRKIADVNAGEITPRLQVAERLERILNPNGNLNYPKFAITRRYGDRLEAQYAIQLKLARYAESLGLMPNGVALDRIEREFLATPMPDSTTRNYQIALTEHDDGTDQVTNEELRRYLKERAARDALALRYDVQPALPRPAGLEVKAAELDQCQLTDVVLTGKGRIPVVEPNDPEIVPTFERLKAERFTRPESMSVAIALADRDKLGAPLVVTDDAAKAWYEKNKSQFPGDPNPKEPNKIPPPKTYDQVKDQVIAKIRSEDGTNKAQKLIDAFNNVTEELEAKRDPQDFRNAAIKAKLEIVVQTIEERTPGTLDLGKLGTFKDVVHLFGRDHEVGFMTQPIETSAGHWLVLRIESRREAGYQTLDEVKDKVIAYIAGRRAWKKLLEESTKIRDSLTGKGPHALATWAESPEGKSWEAKATTKDIGLTQEIEQVGKDADSTNADKILIASLAMPGRPVRLAAADSTWDGDIPRMRLVQAGDIKPSSMDIPADRLLGEYRNALGQFSGTLFNRDISTKLGVR